MARKRLASTLFANVFIAIILTACGGGGGGDGTSTTSATTSFPLAASYKAYTLASSSDTFTVSGSCTGTAKQTVGTPTASSFEGQAALTAVENLQISLVDCSPPSISTVITGYLDPATGLPLGFVDPSGYLVTTASTALPATVKVGDTGTVVTMTRYADGTKAVITGSQTVAYVVSANDASSAKVTVIARILATSGAVLGTQQTTFRLGTDGSVSVLSIDVQTSTGIHLVLTPTGTTGTASSGTTSFSAQSAYKMFATTGETDHFTVTGSCSGGSSIVFNPAQSVVFEGVNGMGSLQKTQTTFSNCNGGALIESDATNYYDANGTLLGITVVGQVYVVFAAPPTALPTNVKVGDSGTIGSYTIYQDSTKAKVTGRRDLTWTIEADTATTVVLNLTTKQYDPAGTLGLTEQVRLRLDGTGKATLLTIDQVYPGGVHLQYTKV